MNPLESPSSALRAPSAFSASAMLRRDRLGERDGVKEHGSRRTPRLGALRRVAGFVLAMASIGFAQHSPASPADAAAKPAAPAIAPLLRSKELAAFQLSDEVKRRFSTEYTFTNRERVLKLEVVSHIDRDNAEVLLKEGVMNVEALYANALSPYPGDISKQVVSDARFHPQFVRTNLNQLTYQYYLVFANERLGYGAVTPDVVKYRSLVGWLYCETAQTLYKLRYFAPLSTPRADLETFFQSFTCPL
jgi:hypothetical protein